ncbi:phytoene desaturase family protein [Sorangium sp. So ce1000]|uniref:phytoene desaturase family protein n=1 Tax=Sorangium sp. So ce1000 TaxID=3133325 RepID=UPI003F620796
MANHATYDALVIGAGPNGLAAAGVLARAGCSVLLIEARETLGGGARTAELTLPGFLHDVCSAIHPMAVASPLFRALPLADLGLSWVHPPSPLAHPFDDGTAAVLERSIEETGRTLGADARAYAALMGPLVEHAGALLPEILGPLRWPRHPLVMARFALRAVRSATGLARSYFRGEHARALFAGCATHATIPLDRLLASAIGLALAVAGHARGWPCARGGSQAITAALSAYFRSFGGEIEVGRRVVSVDELPAAKAILFDLTPRQIVRIAGDRLPARYVRRLERYRYGPGVFKVDWALDGPIPWKAPACLRAATVHVGGTLEEIEAGEAAVWRGEYPARPFVLVAQQSLFDPTRAPSGKQVAWAYCHVPHGGRLDMTAVIEAQIERFAPGFRDRILGRSARSPADLERYNANYVGGDIAGGVTDAGQLFTRPVARLDPYSTPNRSLYICSSSTPPGGGVHGMCGYFAARTALRKVFSR